MGLARLSGEKNQTTGFAPPPGFEILPRSVAGDCYRLEVIHSGAAEGAVGGRKTRRLDDVRLDPKACAQPQDRPGILRNVRLEKGKAHRG
jgi:hypothetical protein